MGLTAGRYSCPLERTAHAIRASLLAAVMTTLITGNPEVIPLCPPSRLTGSSPSAPIVQFMYVDAFNPSILSFGRPVLYYLPGLPLS
jgi:hypothetical protein